MILINWKRCRGGLQRWFSYRHRLRILGLTTLETRFLGADLIEVFKILRGFENIDPERFFQVVRDNGKRGHSSKLFKRRYRMLGVSSLRIACVRSGTGWMMMWLLLGQ